MSIKSISLFKLLKYLARLIKRLCFRDNVFPITYLLDCFLRSTTTGFFEIEMVPIWHMSEQTLRHVYFAVIEDYINIVKILHGLTGSLIRNIYTDFGIYIYLVYLLFSLYN